MSYFGDHTAQQELLDYAEIVQHQFSLSKDQLVAVLLSVTSAVADPYDTLLNEARTHRDIDS